jgi:hypothetical protein
MPAFETRAIVSPIKRFGGTPVMPGLFFQPISLVRIDPVPVARTTAILRSVLTALAALVFKPRTLGFLGRRWRNRYLDPVARQDTRRL